MSLPFPPIWLAVALAVLVVCLAVLYVAARNAPTDPEWASDAREEVTPTSVASSRGGLLRSVGGTKGCAAPGPSRQGCVRPPTSSARSNRGTGAPPNGPSAA